jgi:hypothetical protein
MVTPRVNELHRAGHLDYGHHPVSRQRDVDLERRFTREAARAVGVDPEPFITHAEARILPGPLTDVERREWYDEARCEFSDSRNYFCWKAQDMIASGRTDNLPAVGELLARLLLLWHDLDTLEATEGATDAG